MILLDWLARLLNVSQESSEMNAQDAITLAKRLLFKIDAEHFRQLKDEFRPGCTLDQDFLQIFTLLCSYLAFKDFKKLKCQFERSILANRDASQLLELLLYVAVNSDIKKEVIQSILEFQEDQQCFIMKTIQKIESECEQVTELKKVVEKIESIQQQNENLRDKIGKSEEEYHRKLGQIQQFQAWNSIFAKQNLEYQQEKSSIYKELDIGSMEQFSEIYQVNKNQNEKLTSNLLLIQEEKAALIVQNAKLKKQLKHCGETIQKQIHDIEEIKGKCKLLNQQYWLVDHRLNGAAEEIPLLPLKDNQNLLNSNNIASQEKSKLPTDRTECSNCPDDLEQSFEVKQNLNVLLSLQDLERFHQQKINQIQKLKEQQVYQFEKSRKLDRKVKKIQKYHQLFMNLYQNTKVIKV